MWMVADASAAVKTNILNFIKTQFFDDAHTGILCPQFLFSLFATYTCYSLLVLVFVPLKAVIYIPPVSIENTAYHG